MLDFVAIQNCKQQRTKSKATFEALEVNNSLNVNKVDCEAVSQSSTPILKSKKSASQASKNYYVSNTAQWIPASFLLAYTYSCFKGEENFKTWCWGAAFSTLLSYS
jgi:hypothetical protein